MTTSGIRYVAILDVETTGLDPLRDRVIEVAVTLFDVKHAQPMKSFASLIRGPAANDAYAINRIPAEMLPEAQEPEQVWNAVRWLIEPAQVVIAHNSEFDRKFTPDLGKPWICSENDISWPGRARGGTLVSLALSLGLGVTSAHRAAADVDTLARILTRFAEMGHDLEPVLLHAMRPKVLCHALVSRAQNDTVKSFGFRWNPEQKVWWRNMPLEDAETLPFQVRVVA
jgi:DNA polymerase-3 subunit epsilon